MNIELTDDEAKLVLKVLRQRAASGDLYAAKARTSASKAGSKAFAASVNAVGNKIATALYGSY